MARAGRSNGGMPSPAINTLSDFIPAMGAQLFVNRPRHYDPTPFHDHVFHEIAVVVGGGAIHQSIHGDETIARGDVVVIHPGQWHGFIRCDTLDLYNLGLAPSLIARELAWTRTDPLLVGLLPTNDPGQRVRRLRLADPDLEAVQAALERIMALRAEDPILARSEMIGQAVVVLGRLARQLPYRHVPTHDDDRIGSLATEIEGDLARDWALPELAERAGVSREHLCRRFRVVHGAAPLAWMARRRAERAAVLLLSTDAAVADVGRQVGWRDPNLFARRFRALLGLSPSAFRQRHRPAAG
jgi:AraC family L-rhamnose operon transcriptional activator RhaR